MITRYSSSRYSSSNGSLYLAACEPPTPALLRLLLPPNHTTARREFDAAEVWSPFEVRMGHRRKVIAAIRLRR